MEKWSGETLVFLSFSLLMLYFIPFGFPAQNTLMVAFDVYLECSLPNSISWSHLSVENFSGNYLSTPDSIQWVKKIFNSQFQANTTSCGLGAQSRTLV